MDNLGNRQFIADMQYVVNYQQALVHHMGQFMTHDPQVRKEASAVQLTVKTLALELEHRGLKSRPHIWPPLTREEMVQWAERFAIRQIEASISYAQKHDAALVPALKGYETALGDVVQYCRVRLEINK